MFDFPNSPTLNQTIPMPDGTMRRWDGTKWVAYGVATTPPVVVGDTPPSNPQPGWLWWDSVGGQLYLWFIDAGGPPGQWVPTTNQAAGVPDAPTDGTFYTRRNGVWVPDYAANNTGRNLALNGRFNIWQRGGGSFAANGGMTADRWGMWFNGGSMSVQQQPLGTPGIAAIGDEAAKYYLQAIVTGAAGTNCGVNQQIESIRRVSGKTLTCSFWACASAAGLKLGVGAWLNMGTGGSPSAGGGLPGTAVTLGIPWQHYSVPITVPSMSGQTFGTNGNDSFELDFYMSDSSGNTSYSGGIGQQSGDVLFWGMQCEIGTAATPFERVAYDDDLRHCQRSYVVMPIVDDYIALPNATGIYRAYKLPVTMRATPTITYGNDFTYYSNGMNTAVTPSAGINNTNFVGVRAAGLANAQGFASGTIYASADLI